MRFMPASGRGCLLWGCAVSKNFFEVAHAHSKASNKNSAMAVSGGLSYSPSYQDHDDFDLPPAYWLLRDLPERFGCHQEQMLSCAAMYGARNFRLTVLGLAKERSSKWGGAYFVCKCSCSMFCLRRGKSIKTGRFLTCGVCQQNRDRFRNEYHAKHGIYPDDSVVWQRMGGA